MDGTLHPCVTASILFGKSNIITASCLSQRKFHLLHRLGCEIISSCADLSRHQEQDAGLSQRLKHASHPGEMGQVSPPPGSEAIYRLCVISKQQFLSAQPKWLLIQGVNVFITQGSCKAILGLLETKSVMLTSGVASSDTCRGQAVTPQGEACWAWL